MGGRQSGSTIVIVGAGIGGVALALALRRAGIDAVVLERAPSLEAVGAGIQLSPNATRVLGWLGVMEALGSRIVRPRRHRFVDWRSGETLLTTPLGEAVSAEFGSIYAHAHRADLLSAFLAVLGAGPWLRLGAEVVEIGQGAERAFARLASGEVVEGDAVVAADGVRSRAREVLFAPEPPRFSGHLAWRGLTPAEDVEDLGFEHDSYIFMGPGRSVVAYYVAAGRLLNWIAIGPSDGDTRESWTTRGTVEAALVELDGWHPMVRQLVARSEPPFKWALYDREPLERWVAGRIGLLGDAAHAMLPYHAQGAAQSIEDAWVLARRLALTPDDVPGALATYEALRRPRTRQVQAASRAAERLFHLAEREAVHRRNRRFAATQARIGEGFPPGQAWLFAYDAEKAATGTDDEWRALAWRGTRLRADRRDDRRLRARLERDGR